MIARQRTQSSPACGPLITPLTADREIDEAGVQRLVSFSSPRESALCSRSDRAANSSRLPGGSNGT